MMFFAALAITAALMLAIAPGWSGLATTPRWDIGALIALILFLAPRGRMSPAHWCGLVLVFWLVASLAWSSSPIDGADQALKLAAIVAAFALGAVVDDILPLIAGAAVGLAISGIVSVAQWLGWHAIDSYSYGTPGGLFFSGSRQAEVAVMVLAAALAERMWLALPGLIPAIALPQERIAWLVAAIVIAVYVWQRARLFERFVVLAIGGWAVVFAAMTVGLWWRTDAFGWGGLAERWVIWQFTVTHLDVLGHGLGAFVHDGPYLDWAPAAATTAGNLSHAEHPHNEFLWLAYEGGVPALVLFGAFAVLVWRAAVDAHRLVLVALGLIACAAMPFHDPATILFSALCAGFAVGADMRVRAAAHAGRSALCAWVETELAAGRECGGAEAGGEPLSVPAAVS